MSMSELVLGAYEKGYNKAKADQLKFIEDLKQGLDYDDEEDRVFLNKIDELSSKETAQ
jgi:hypothetical protein